MGANMVKPGDVIPMNGERYIVVKELGTGAFGEVYLVTEESTGKDFACKVIDKRKLNNPEDAEREINNMKSLNHPNIIKLFDANDKNGFLYLLMEYASGGELCEYIQSKQITEELAKQLFRQIVSGVHYLHLKGIAHRDLKPLNILLSNGKIKIADFGISRKFKYVADAQMSSMIGTKKYAAPEVFDRAVRSYNGCKADMYSLGKILEDIATNYGENEMPSDCKALYEKLTSINPSSRPSAAQVLNDSWLESNDAGCVIL